jgi:hypothetical protein
MLQNRFKVNENFEADNNFFHNGAITCREYKKMMIWHAELQKVCFLSTFSKSFVKYF